MAAPPSSRLQSMLQAAVQSVQWTYSLFWQICPQQGVLIWGDGYYNGAIKTRKTVQPMEVSAEEASLQRSQQLRELYDSLSAGETNQPVRRPCAALSPEDLTESEWFYLMCVSFSFPPGVGLPGKAYARRQHVWLVGANEVDSKTFSRAILAKSARIQTVVCIPLLDGVVEFGTTEKVEEDTGLIQHVKSYFSEHLHHHPPPPKPAPSEDSTSNPATSSGHPHFLSPPITAMYASADPPPNTNQLLQQEDDGDEDEEDDEDEDEHGSDSEAETGRNTRSGPSLPQNYNVGVAADASELMQVDMSEDIRVGSPDDASNNMDSDFHLMGLENTGDVHRQRTDSFRGAEESARRWSSMMQDPIIGGGLQVQPTTSGPAASMDQELTQEDTHYSQTVSTVLQNRHIGWGAESSSSAMPYTSHSIQSAFAKWTSRVDQKQYLQHLQVPMEGTSQWLLKYILFSVPLLHSKNSRDSDGGANRGRKGGTPQEELSANHVLAERRRREKLNERFIILRSLVPFVTKMDKASILGDTIEYVKQLRKKIQDLEARNQRQMDHNQQQRGRTTTGNTSSIVKESQIIAVDEKGGSSTRSSMMMMKKKKKKKKKKLMMIVEGGGNIKAKKLKEDQETLIKGGEKGDDHSKETNVEVSIIERDALLEIQCRHREGLLLDLMQMLRDHLRIETTAVHSSLNTGGLFVAELRAQVKDNVNGGKKVSITEVKRAIYQIIPHD